MSTLVGTVQGLAASVSVTPVVTASSAYTAGNQVGGLLTFNGALNQLGQAILQSVTISTKSVQTTGFKLYVFTANPTNTTWADKTTPSIAAADLPALAGYVTLSTSDSGLGTMSVYELDGIAKAIANADLNTSQVTQTSSGEPLYGILVTTGTPTFASTSDLTVTVSTLW
jgi:hypothetical protein